ncbi:MAG: glucokinase [Candidatus Saganbacteria bacterium]|uniref:Glucokinase n=1 Tax=Candidatus Saganbacteria bacterium TaxID=2575572 RepID=A0A833L1B0_UNCSA|nr:MAG: glucokinase [Candidatus Saganbacteria bacterium]
MGCYLNNYNFMENIIIGIDLGGSKIAAAAADQSGNIVSEIIVPTEAEHGRKKVISNIEKAIAHLKASTKANILKIGIGVPGPINYETGMVISPPNLPGWKKVNLKEILSNFYNAPVFVDNDANCAALGEALFGAGKKATNFIFITVSTGIGGGIIINKNIYRGATGSAGEFGHMIIDPSGPRCGCGNKGDLEALASGTSIKKRSGEDAMAIHIKAQQGDKKAKKIIYKTAHYLGVGIANLVNIFNPELVIVGGGLSNMGALLLKPTIKEFKKYVLPLPGKSVKIVRAKLGARAGLLGAVALCL